ncbi:hypothetical protein WG66_005812 [Moniliophthora roreri]|nr:hypothetical protein WG66_005812 [Moniliophthora roreri]
MTRCSPSWEALFLSFDPLPPPSHCMLFPLPSIQTSLAGCDGCKRVIQVIIQGATCRPITNGHGHQLLLLVNNW